MSNPHAPRPRRLLPPLLLLLTGALAAACATTGPAESPAQDSERAANTARFSTRDYIDACAAGQGALTSCTRACEAGDGDSCLRLGTLYLEGSGVDADQARAASIFLDACQAHDALRACSYGSLMQLKGWGIDADPAAAVARLETTCQASEPLACLMLGNLHESGDLPALAAHDLERAATLYETACRGDEPDACYNLAALHHGKQIAEANPAQATRLFGLACEGGAALGRTALGTLAVEAGDSARAAEHFRRACDAGEPQGCFGAGVVYGRGGQGVAQDPEAARRYIERACQAGHARACRLLE